MAFANMAGLCSGIVMALAGAGLLAARPKREGGYFFAVFCLLWGLQTTTTYAAELSAAHSVLFRTFKTTSLALVVPLPLLLIHFAVRWPWSPHRNAWAWTWGAAAIALTAAAAFVLRPTAFVTFQETGTGINYQLGLAQAVLMAAPFFASFFIAVGLLLVKYLREKASLLRKEIAIALTALALYLGYIIPFDDTYYILDFPQQRDLLGTAVATTYAAIFALGTVVFLACVLALVRKVRARGDGLDRFLLAAFVSAAALGAATGLPIVFGAEGIFFFAVPRIVATGVIIYGILKHQLFGIDLGVKLAIRGGVLVAPIIVVFFVVSELTSNWVQDATGQTGAGIGAAALLAVAGKQIDKVARKVSDKALPGVKKTQAYKDARRIEVYRAMLEGFLVDGVLTKKDTNALQHLAQKLGVTGDEARRLEVDVRKALGV